MMKTIRKVEVKFPGERITQAKVLEDGSCELVVEIVVNEGREEVGVKHKTKNGRETKFKDLIETVNSGHLPPIKSR